MPSFNETEVEYAAVAWLEELGFTVLRGPEIAYGEALEERHAAGYHEVVLENRLRQAIQKLNPFLPDDARSDAFKQLLRINASTLIENNRRLHRLLVNGVTVEYRRPDGSIAGAQANILDFDIPANNDWLAVSQFTVIEGQHNRRPDIVLFVNGLPLAVLELKNAADENANLEDAYRQLVTYQSQIPTLFAYNAALVISDGFSARIGSVGAGSEWFKQWREFSGVTVTSSQQSELQVLLAGVFEHQRFLDMIRYFTVFEDVGASQITKKLAGYHQVHAVNAAMNATLRAIETDHRIGLVWHTQGSGKSLTMAFYAGRVILHPQMSNPSVVVLTDRNDLDDQLFGTFSRCRDLLRQPPVQAASRADLRQKLSVAGGGVVFTTIQKFFPDEHGDRHALLSERRNIVVIADEAHRSQYDFIDGYARHMRDALPNASFVGFTGTPIDQTDRITRGVFGTDISIYDIKQAVEDGATVPIYYESRLAKLALSEAELPYIDPNFEEVTEAEEVDYKEKLKTKWAQLEVIVGSEHRLQLIAQDLIKHFEARLETMNGKAMIVCMSRRICVDVYKSLVALRPDWHNESDDQGKIKVIMTGSASDPLEWQPHIRNKPRREALAIRFRNPEDDFQIVIVRDMWLTGFDAPSLHTMYIDKPMRGHGLMQAIARVNRVFKDKPGGLVVDYLGIKPELDKALATYAGSGGKGTAAFLQADAVDAMLAKYDICKGIFYGFLWHAWYTGTPQQRLSLLPAAQEHILAQRDGKERFIQAVSDLSKAFALAVPDESTIEIRDDVAFFQAVRAVLQKKTMEQSRSDAELDLAIRQLVSDAIVPDGVVDIFAASGLNKPNISILSDEFLAGVQSLPQRNLAVEVLRKLLSGEITRQQKSNVVQSRSFAKLLEDAVRKYQNRAIETAMVIEELIALAKHMREEEQRGQKLGLTDDELAFYDALGVNDSAVQVLGDETLRDIARQLVVAVRANVTIDWTVRETVRAQLRVIVKRILRKRGYPPDKQESATKTVIEQAEVLSKMWAIS